MKNTHRYGQTHDNRVHLQFSGNHTDFTHREVLHDPSLLEHFPVSCWLYFLSKGRMLPNKSQTISFLNKLLQLVDAIGKQLSDVMCGIWWRFRWYILNSSHLLWQAWFYCKRHSLLSTACKNSISKPQLDMPCNKDEQRPIKLYIHVKTNSIDSNIIWIKSGGLYNKVGFVFFFFFCCELNGHRLI